MNSTRQLINSSGNHAVQICLNINSQVDLITGYIKNGLLNGEAIFIISKFELRKILKLKINKFSFDGQALQDLNQIRFFDAKYLLLSLESDGVIEEEAFQENVVVPINHAQSQYKKVRAFGEMADILWEQRQHDMMRQLVGYWENLTNAQELSLLCTYSLDQLDPDSYDEVLERICKYHSYLSPQQEYGSIGPRVDEEMLSIFGAAWSRVTNKLAIQQSIA